MGWVVAGNCCRGWALGADCPRLLCLQDKKKRLGALLVVGTAAGDVLAYDTQLGELKWRASGVVEG